MATAQRCTISNASVSTPTTIAQPQPPLLFKKTGLAIAIIVLPVKKPPSFTASVAQPLSATTVSNLSSLSTCDPAKASVQTAGLSFVLLRNFHSPRDTHECLFKEYWDIVKQEEGISRHDLVAVEQTRSSNKARSRMKGFIPTPTPTPTPKRLPNTLQHEHTNSKSKSKSKPNNNNTHKFLGWGSKPLIEFLTSFGVDSTKQLSPSEVSSIILKYVQQNDLIHPINNKKVICDRLLHLIFKKNTISMKHIDLLLGPHFFHDNNENHGIGDNRSRSEPDQPQINGDTALNKHYKTSNCSQDKPTFASVVPHNINLVYLRRSLVEDLLKQPESFEDKVVGSFVKIMDTNSSQLQSKGRISQRLLQVTAVSKMSSRDGKSVVLHVWRLPNIPISMLSDSDLTEEDCRDLKEKMEKGLLQRPTVEEIENKARILHQDIRKNACSVLNAIPTNRPETKAEERSRPTTNTPETASRRHR
ncbi:zinc finger CCCH domain-containing protein 19-like [Cucumis melo var. makuwa]|uniref:Zinc finger CCCH domain-containing protein 19-like n=1 Tax=Cucumis melo var. makuwa TaxID=1194695 RepID=A0A5D3DAZ4_CUCMM|nr:zinc finger CCCH domain-containing protein 19-like [Cucumis melo var. makuwa]TYK20771.1 zinc finger CCCH domain-containing protein 19-like [Cucumis melo var. makuwa]